MPRPRLIRRVRYRRAFPFFKPAGVPANRLKISILTVDEFEALHLKDLETLGQKDAAKKMNISQPTFHRLILSARKKLADAIVKGKAIKIEGGSYKMKNPRRLMQMRGQPPKKCVCSNTKCNYSESKRAGLPCSEIRCPKCGSRLIRGN